MPLYRKIQENGLLVGVWKTEETVEQLLALLGNISMYKSFTRFCSNNFTSPAMQVVDFPDPGRATVRLLPVRDTTASAMMACSLDSMRNPVQLLTRML